MLRYSIDTAVSTTAVLLLVANPNRTGLILQEVGGTNAARFGGQGIDGSAGIRVAGGATLVLQDGACPMDAIYAIRDSADCTVCATEIGG